MKKTVLLKMPVPCVCVSVNLDRAVTLKLISLEDGSIKTEYYEESPLYLEYHGDTLCFNYDTHGNHFSLTFTDGYFNYH